MPLMQPPMHEEVYLNWRRLGTFVEGRHSDPVDLVDAVVIVD